MLTLEDLHRADDALLDFVEGADGRVQVSEVQYASRHALVRDVAYGQVVRAERAEKHRRAAAWIEGTTPDLAVDRRVVQHGALVGGQRVQPRGHDGVELHRRGSALQCSVAAVAQHAHVLLGEQRVAGHPAKQAGLDLVEGLVDRDAGRVAVLVRRPPLPELLERRPSWGAILVRALAPHRGPNVDQERKERRRGEGTAL